MSQKTRERYEAGRKVEAAAVPAVVQVAPVWNGLRRLWMVDGVAVAPQPAPPIEISRGDMTDAEMREAEHAEEQQRETEAAQPTFAGLRAAEERVARAPTEQERDVGVRFESVAVFRDATERAALVGERARHRRHPNSHHRSFAPGLAPHSLWHAIIDARLLARRRDSPPRPAQRDIDVAHSARRRAAAFGCSGMVDVHHAGIFPARCAKSGCRKPCRSGSQHQYQHYEPLIFSGVPHAVAEENL